MDINYSIIIPHKNCPDLLERCLNSIPIRDDIQIIVIDDNSEYNKKPVLRRENIKILFLDISKSKGAGRARNIGIEESLGKWLLFADSDDYFTELSFSVFDEYLNSSYEVIYFNSLFFNSETLQVLPKPKELVSIDDFDGSRNAEEKIKYLKNAPWGKMLRKDFVLKHNIKYEEIVKGNDTFFAYQVGFFSSSVAIDKRDVYVYTMNGNSITNGSKTIDIYKQSLKNTYKSNSFLKFVGHPEWQSSIIRYLASLFFKESLIYWIRILIMFVLDYKEITADKYMYVTYFTNARSKANDL